MKTKGFTLDFTIENPNIDEVFAGCKAWMEKKKANNLSLESPIQLTGRIPKPFLSDGLAKDIIIKLSKSDSGVLVSISFNHLGLPPRSKYNTRWNRQPGWMMQDESSKWVELEKDLRIFLEKL